MADEQTTEQAASDVEQAANDDGKKKRKRKSSGPRGPRSSHVFGRDVVLEQIETPENGHAPETTLDYRLFKHKLPRESQFQDPLDFWRLVKEQYVKQLAELADSKIASMEGIGSAATRSNMLAVGNKLGETMEAMVDAVSDSSATEESDQRILEQAAAMMAELQARLEAKQQAKAEATEES